MKLSGYIPILEWLPKYQRKYLGSDLLAGLTVGVMVIPQGMAYGMLAGLPPIYGLYASLVPMAIYALLGTSKHLVIGPAAMVSLMVAFGVGQLAEPSTAEFIRLATTLALMVGIIQFSLGMLRMGFLTNFLSYPILSGFTSAASIIIFFSQLKHLVGIDLARTQHVHKIIFEAMKRFGELQPQTLIVGLAGIGIIVLASRIHKAIPSALLAVIFGICAAYFMPLEAQGVLLVGNVPEGLPVFAMPNLEFSNLKSLFPIALTISLIGILESMVIAKAIHRRHKDYDIIPNQEFRALGIANLLGSMFQAYPSDASFSRSAINDEAGAKTGVSSLVGAAIVALTLIFITGWFYYLPKAILASVIMVAIVKLINVKDARFLWRSNRTDFFMLLATFLATLFIYISGDFIHWYPARHCYRNCIISDYGHL
jgi:SulP family sulfate permease